MKNYKAKKHKTVKKDLARLPVWVVEFDKVLTIKLHPSSNYFPKKIAVNLAPLGYCNFYFRCSVSKITRLLVFINIFKSNSVALK